MRDAIRSLTLVAVVAAVGCTPESKPDTDDKVNLRDGLNWITVESGKRLDGVYVAGDQTLFFELRRGGLMAYTPKPMIDGRLMDSAGRVLMWQIAADDFIDPTWGTIRDIYDPSPERSDGWQAAEHHIAIGQSLMTDLTIAPAPEGNAEELDALRLMVRAFTTPIDDPDIAPLDSTLTVYNANNYHKIQVHSKSCCGGGGDHSATKSLYKTCSGCATRVYVNRCNHDECPGDTGMSLKCSTTWYGPRSNLYPKGDTKCSTQYDITSTSGHNCNDDTELQGRSIKYNAYQDTNDGYPCNNGTPHNNAPDCGF